MEIGQLPEECISVILSFTSPREACRSALVSPIFRSASESNYVWEKFLPSDYKQYVSQSRQFSVEILNSMSKKSLYFHLCDNPIIIGNGNMSFSVDRESGKKCFMVGARGLSIVWGDSPQYWEWKSSPESRFSEVAKLSMVWWLHVSTSFETRALSPQTTYEVYFVFKLSRDGSEFRRRPVDLYVQFDDGQDHNNNEAVTNAILSRRSIERVDTWREIVMGQFYNENGEEGSVSCNLKEVSCSHYWSGLIIQGIEFRPRLVI